MKTRRAAQAVARCSPDKGAATVAKRGFPARVRMRNHVLMRRAEAEFSHSLSALRTSMVFYRVIGGAWPMKLNTML